MFRLRSFGGLVLERDGAPYTGPATQRRRLALLAVLAAAPDSGVSRDRLTDYLWPAADPARARHSLDDALSALRREFGSQDLFLRATNLRLNPAVLSSDVADHGAALRSGDGERAVALYAGPFLDGFYVPDAGGFERWVEAERGRLAQAHAGALEGLAAAAADGGDPAAAVRWWKARVAVDPLDTSATLRLLAAVAAAGNPTEALRLARVHEALVREEFDSVPGAGWSAAVENIRRELAAPPAPARPLTAVPSQSVHHEAITTLDQPGPAPPISGTVDAIEAVTTPAGRTGSGARAESAASVVQEVHPRSGRWTVPLVAAAIVLAIGGGTVWHLRRGGSAPPSAGAATRRVLVVPFENATGDSALSPLGRMAADWVAEGLAEVNNVTVTTDFTSRPKAGDAGLRATATENEAGTVVSGTYYSDGDSIRLQPRITDVAGWALVRSVPPVTAPRKSPTALLEPLRQRIMAVLAVTHDPRFTAFAAGAPPPSYEAYEQYLAGTDVFEHGDWAGALPYYARAVALDSSYVQPLLGAADGYLNLSRPAAADTLVRLLERRRGALTPADRGSVDRLRGVLDGDRMATLMGARATAVAAPGAQLPRFLWAVTALRAGRPREALTAAAPIASSFGRDRTSWAGSIYWSAVTSADHMLGRYEAERDAARTARAYHPDSPDVRAYEMRSLAALGRLDSLRAGLAELEVVPLAPGATPLPALLIFVAQELDAHGHHEEARQTLRRAVAAASARPAASQQTPSARHDLAHALYLLGEYGAAAPLFVQLAAEQPDNPQYIGYQGLIAAHRGRYAQTERVAQRLRTLRRPYDRGQTTYARAQIAAVLGDRAMALTLIIQARSEGVPYGTSLHVDPDLATLRSEPGFQALLRPQG